MPHRYDDDPMAYVPYRRGTVTVSARAFATLCAFAVVGVLAILAVLLVS